MNKKQDRLNRLRKRAEYALNNMDISSDVPHEHLDDLVQELQVYQAELELQLEDLQQANEQLEAAHHRYTSLFDFAPIGYVVTDLHGKIVNINVTARTLFGIEDESWQGARFGAYIHKDERDVFHLHLQRVLRSHLAHDVELRVYGEGGTVFHARLTTQHHVTDEPTLRTAVMDISTIKRAREILTQTLRQQQQLTHVQQRVLSVIAHEFRTPLATIISSANMLERYNDRLTEEKRNLRLHNIRDQSWYLNELIQDVQIISESEGDLPPLRPTTFELLPFVRNTLDNLNEINKGDQHIALQAASLPEDLLVTWDQHLLRSMIQNLGSNALKYSEDVVTCTLDADHDTVYLHIADKGTGIAPQDLPHIFEAFYRGDNAEFIRGTGVGLYVAERAAAAHGGTLTCESTVGEGTTMTATLPRHAPAGA